jgi:hypothetical protein
MTTNVINTSIDPQLIGDTLYYIFTRTDPYYLYNDFYNEASSVRLDKVKDYITEVYNNKLGISLDLRIPAASKYPTLLKSIVQAGDILIRDNRYYVVTQAIGDNIPVTWPKLFNDDYEYFYTNKFNSYNIIRPDYSQSDTLVKNLKDISREILKIETNLDELLDDVEEGTRIDYNLEQIYSLW